MSETPRVAIVTGAAGGIGREMVRCLLAAGIRVAGVDRDRGPLEGLATSAREQGKATDLLTIQADLTVDSAVAEITGATRARFDRIDIPATMPGSVRVPSVRTPGSARLNSGRSRPIGGDLSSPSTPPRRLCSPTPSCMMRRGWGRIVNVTTSLGTMLNDTAKRLTSFERLKPTLLRRSAVAS